MRNIFTLFILLSFTSMTFAQEICDNGIDDDSDGLIDLNDDECECLPITVDSILSLIPNSSFENYDCLPTLFSQMDCATDWIQASSATSDYLHLNGFFDGSYYGVPTVPLPIPDGDGFVGFIDGQPAGALAYKEYIGACLSSPLIEDSTYTFTFDIGFGTPNYIYGSYQWISDTVNLGFYAATDCSLLPFETGYNFGCPTDYPGWDELGTLTMWGSEEWVSGTFTFTPSDTYDVLVIGPDCNLNAGLYASYFFLDDLTVNQSSLFSAAILSGEQTTCEDYTLTIENTNNLAVQWYLDGIALLGETSDDLLLSSPDAGTYQATISDGLACSLSNGYAIADSIAEINFSFSGDFEICDGDSTTISVTGDFATIDWGGQDVTSVTYTSSETVIVSFSDSVGCMIDTTITITVSDPINYTFSGDFDVCTGLPTTIYVSGDYDSIDWNGANVDSVTYTSSQTDMITFTDSQGCTTDTTIVVSITSDCACEITDVTATLEECDGLEYSITIDVDVMTISTAFELDIDGNAYGTYNYADLPISIGPFPGDGISSQSITVTDADILDCSFSVDAGPQSCFVCDIDNVDVEYVCTDTLGYEAYLSFTGSNLYTISDGTTVWTDVNAGADIFLGYYPENTNLSITIIDQQVDDCETEVGPFTLNCDCDSEAGTIMVNSMYVCPDEVSIVDADDFLLEPGQSVYYLYHSQSSVSLSDLPDLTSEVYTTGSFLVNDGSTIPCGDVVYVTAIGAYEDASMSGFPDYTDFCMTVSNTIPVSFLCPISITVSEICDSDFGEFTYAFSIDGGLPAADNTQTYDVTGDGFNGAGISVAELISVGPMTDLSSYTITATDANGCSTTVTNLVECEKVPIELIDFGGEATEAGNLISWTTASEINNDYFTLESSKDGNNFFSLSRIEGAGTTSDINEYSYLDIDYNSNITYYRLKQTDFDGSVSYSRILQLVSRIESSDIFSLLSAQPITGVIDIELNAEHADIYLIDTKGSIVFSTNTTENFLSIKTDQFSGGIYYLNISTADKQQAEKILIKH